MISPAENILEGRKPGEKRKEMYPATNKFFQKAKIIDVCVNSYKTG